jgi:hypothetical protein
LVTIDGRRLATTRAPVDARRHFGLGLLAVELVFWLLFGVAAAAQGDEGRADDLRLVDALLTRFGTKTGDQ